MRVRPLVAFSGIALVRKSDRFSDDSEALDSSASGLSGRLQRNTLGSQFLSEHCPLDRGKLFNHLI